MTPEEIERRRGLAVVAAALAAEVPALRKIAEDQAKALDDLTKEVRLKTRMTTVKIRWMIALVIMDLVLSGAMLVGYLKISDLVKNQCPILSDLLGAYDPSTRTPGHDRNVYEFNKALERHIYNDLLDCKTQLVPPRSDLVTTTPPVPPK